MLPLAVVPPALGTGPDAPVTVPLATPLTRGAAVGVVKGPLGPVLALRCAGLGAFWPDIAILCSCTNADVVSWRGKGYKAVRIFGQRQRK